MWRFTGRHRRTTAPSYTSSPRRSMLGTHRSQSECLKGTLTVTHFPGFLYVGFEPCRRLVLSGRLGNGSGAVLRISTKKKCNLRFPFGATGYILTLDRESKPHTNTRSAGSCRREVGSNATRFQAL